MGQSYDLPDHMTYVDVTQPGGPDTLTLLEGPVPQPREHEVLIRVAAAGVNRPDIAQREGRYPPPPGASPIMGLEVAGTVVAVGAGSQWRVGDEVCALAPGGGYATYCRVPDLQCLPLPKNVSVEACAGIPETFFTVWANVFQIGQLKAGERILIHGGTSGIGTTAIQLAKAFGATVYATAGSDEKCQACLDLGAAAAINYRSQDFAEEIKRLTNGQGVDAILDIIGAPYTARNIESLAPKGRLLLVSTQGGAHVEIDLSKIMQKRLTITGSTMRPRTVEDKGVIASELHDHVWPLLEAGQVHVPVDRVFALDQVADAHRYLESSQHIGKIILRINDQ
jgi:putative PIG3 family NAD(P)H quinone oxidoreductase